MIRTKSLESRIGLEFRDRRLLAEALTHRSYLNEHRREKIGHNERLEFLGDAVLELAVTEYLFDRYPNKNEGDLTSIRSALVSSKMLTEIALDIGLSDYLRLSRGELRDARSRPQILANALEAIIGALYKDAGPATTYRFIAKHILARVTDKLAAEGLTDPKSRLQSWCRRKIASRLSTRLLPNRVRITISGLRLVYT